MYVGRFAPSPTGPLHYGSLLTALASFLAARQAGGRWLIRIDDIDPPRAQDGAETEILACLHAHALIPDAPVIYQSTHQANYERALGKLQPLSFFCTCSRRSVSQHPVYPGTCRAFTEPRPHSALRLNTTMTDLTSVVFEDGFAGTQARAVAEIGDFIIRRRDGLIAYQLATAVDDSRHGGRDAISHVLRGQDLIEVTFAQQLLMHTLGSSAPHYTHLPLLEHPDGSKLSKQTGATPVDQSQVARNLQWALATLGQAPPANTGQPASFWLQWGTSNWNIERVPMRLAPFDGIPAG
ncbi:MAG: tRNA glutamyl-Q(34) synthetase GluQRS [Pseudomonadota bacterium]